MIDFQFLFENFPSIISDLSWQLIYILKKKKNDNKSSPADVWYTRQPKFTHVSAA